jgi:predicted regulator of Ras-like GTPase activity (Roadblock/LC7/MglB family)
MVDYYLLLSRAVAGIPRSMPNARQALYERARKTLATDLQDVPATTQTDFEAEKRALEEAIARIESEIPSQPAPTAPGREKQQAPEKSDANGAAVNSRPTLVQAPPPRLQSTNRPTLSELLRRVDDAMKEPTLPPPKQSAEDRKEDSASRSRPSLIKTPNADEKPKTIGRPWKRTLEPQPPPVRRSPTTVLPSPRPPIMLPTVQSERSTSKEAEFNAILKNFQFASPGMEASALISRSGQMIASLMNPEMEEARIAGVTATLLNLCGRAAAELARGEVHEIIVRADHGYAVMIGAGHDALLLALANDQSQLGYIFFSMQEAIKSFEKLL